MKQRTKMIGRVGGALAPKLVEFAPSVTSGFVQRALHQAIVGVGPLPGAVKGAEKQLADHSGDADSAIREIIEHHVGYAGAEGFATNVGGLVTFAATLPAAVTGLALLQCRMVAQIAHLRGYDIDDQQVRNAILACLLGEDRVAKDIKKKTLPGPPSVIATTPVVDPDLDDRVAAEIASEILSRVAGKRMVGTVARRIPGVGGVVGAGTDAWATFRIGRYAARELRPRAAR